MTNRTRKNSRSRSSNDTNRNARIESRITKNGKFRTETVRRNSGINVAASTDLNSKKTSLYVDGVQITRRRDGSSAVKLSGREARTLLRLIVSHYDMLDM